MKTEMQASNPFVTDQENDMTPELLKTFPGFEHYTDQQAIEIVQTIKQLAEILYDLAMQDETHNIHDELYNGTTVGLPDNETNMAA